MHTIFISTFFILFASLLSQAGRIPPSSSAVKNLNQQFLEYESNVNRQNPNKPNIQPSTGGLNNKPANQPVVSQPAHSPSHPINTSAKPAGTHGVSSQNLNAHVSQPANKPVLGINNAQTHVTHGPSQNSHVNIGQPAGKPGNVPQSLPTNHGVANQNSHIHVGQPGGNPQSPPPTHGVTNQDLNKHLSQHTGKPTSTSNANKNNPYDTNFPALPSGQNVKELVQLYNSRDEENRRAHENTRPHKYSDVVAGTHKSRST